MHFKLFSSHYRVMNTLYPSFPSHYRVMSTLYPSFPSHYRVMSTLYPSFPSHYRVMSTLYPSFPSEREFNHNLVSLSEGRSTTPGSTPFCPILAQFVEDRHRLAVGSALLPDLVEFYLWLDQRLAHLLPYEAAPKLTVDNIILKATKRFPSEADTIRPLFNRMKG